METSPWLFPSSVRTLTRVLTRRLDETSPLLPYPIIRNSDFLDSTTAGALGSLGTEARVRSRSVTGGNPWAAAAPLQAAAVSRTVRARYGFMRRAPGLFIRG
jgi:hypothetical protein